MIEYILNQTGYNLPSSPAKTWQDYRFTSLQALLSDNTSDLSIYIATAMQGSIQTTVDDRAKVHPKNTIDISLE